ncbi:peptidylprolyl isomerase [Pseudoflavitalea rhizosphaerae]|uniref:peptidylprolyl isomerase n=1 Tax=Pseudoflavitalea rhizosphaerae TaxID=1884793 RepID=UPI000F8E04FE|nr:peptidylprolyl isomerase [Pseudoflavitalea rhizosphaerae]
MSVIQTIRDKAAWIIIAAIALALIAFIVQDAFQGRGGGMFGGSSDVIGKVNGKKIDAYEFDARYKAAEQNYQAQNYSVDERLRGQIRESLWNEYVEDAILGNEFEKIGFAEIGKDERGDILYGENPPQMLRQQFTDPKTGAYDANTAYQTINQLKKNTPQFNSFYGEFLPALEKARMKEKFVSLISNSAYTPKWLVEKMNTENSQVSNISYVNIPYSSVGDSAIRVTDEDVRQYVNENKEAYQQEEARGIEYVMFDAAPTAADSAVSYEGVASVKNEFAAIPEKDVESFLLRNNSELPYFNGYVLGSNMKVSNADSIKQLGEGQVFGPYLDGSNYTIAKMIGRRAIPDTVKVRHILVKIADPQAGQVRTDSAAKFLIDSITTAIRNGASFDSMVVKYSDDMGSKETQGEYTFESNKFGQLSREFAEVAFYGNAGDKKTVKVENSSYSGYHYIEVLNQKNIGTGFKIAYLSHPIIASAETVNGASTAAAQFALDSKDKKSFDENAKKQNLNKYPAMDIKPLESGIPGLGDNRELVTWMFRTAKVGQVAERYYQIGDKFIVPVLVAAYEKGNMSVDRARPLVEYKIRNKKKADEIVKKVGGANTLDGISKAVNQPVLKADSISYASPFVPNVGNEPKLIGAAFCKKFQTAVSTPVVGEIGVFYLKIDNLGAQPNPNFDVKQMQTMMNQQQRMVGMRVIEAMKKSADIKDYRINFF